MHNHSSDKGGRWMKWTMMLCCIVPLVILLFLGFGGKSLGASNSSLFVGVGGMILIHFLIMNRAHGKHEKHKEVDGSDGVSDKDKKDHSGHGCCK